MDLIYVIYYLARLSSAYAFDDLSYNKSAIQSHTYRDTIYEAGNAVDGNILTCMRTQEIGRSSLDKTVWWRVDLGGVYNIYCINIVFRNYESWDGWVNRQRGRFAGFSLYVSVTGDIQGSILCYKDGPQLPPLNFTTTCTEHGRYIIFYNERLDGAKYPAEYETANVYTELCEVVVQGCKVSGVFGINCDKPCPANCKDNLCHIENGSCFWCKTGWTGKFCDTACQPGYFGENCSMPCSPNCKTCRNTDGLCSCKAGWMGHNCSTECTQSYGENCQYSCSLHCINQTCDRFNGKCLCDVKLGKHS
nr:multiple epidermal growth factor-like domains protein 6 isoform X2 [Crassostrea gigas]